MMKLILLILVSSSMALPKNTISFQGVTSWITPLRGVHLGYEYRQGENSVLAKLSGYWWENQMSLLDSNGQQIFAYGVNVSGRRYLPTERKYYLEVAGGYTAFNQAFTGEEFHYFSVGGFIGRKFMINRLSIDFNCGLMIPSESPKQLEQEGVGGKPNVLPFSFFGEAAKMVIRNFMPNSLGEANLMFGINF